jgi:NADH-quinone oxidoreductase subunit I
VTISVKTVRRRKTTFLDRLYLPAVFKGLSITFMRLFRPKITMQFPEERWTVREHYRGMPVLVSDDEGRPKCVACSMCEYVCPPKAIFIVPQELEGENKVERGPAVFDLNMLRCIYCGLCEEACPEEAIFMSKEYMVYGAERSDLLFHKEKLYELGGVRSEGVKKWKDK